MRSGAAVEFCPSCSSKWRRFVTLLDTWWFGYVVIAVTHAGAIGLLALAWVFSHFIWGCE